MGRMPRLGVRRGPFSRQHSITIPRRWAVMTGVAKKTVMRLVVEVGAFCAEYQDEVFHNLKCRRIQVDECWQYVYCKQRNLTPKIAARQISGDTWLWVAIDAETK